MATTELTPRRIPPVARELNEQQRLLETLRDEPCVLADLWQALADQWQAIGYSLHETKCRKREMHYLQRAATLKENEPVTVTPEGEHYEKEHIDDKATAPAGKGSGLAESEPHHQLGVAAHPPDPWDDYPGQENNQTAMKPDGTV